MNRGFPSDADGPILGLVGWHGAGGFRTSPVLLLEADDSELHMVAYGEAPAVLGEVWICFDGPHPTPWMPARLKEEPGMQAEPCRLRLELPPGRSVWLNWLDLVGSKLGLSASPGTSADRRGAGSSGSEPDHTGSARVSRESFGAGSRRRGR